MTWLQRKLRIRIRDADRWSGRCVFFYNSIGEPHFVRELYMGCFRAGSVRGALVLECCVLGCRVLGRGWLYEERAKVGAAAGGGRLERRQETVGTSSDPRWGSW